MRYLLEWSQMKNNSYSLSGEKNPYTKRIKKQITINIDSDTIDYFKDLATETGIPYQTLINMYLADCVKNHRKPDISWDEPTTVGKKKGREPE